ncbi:hypothetical protein KAR91_35935 [Candidatus Pacearchaeota archaeon]|nr:hypothetical protein [Candidatus Pacearchaeota archaeon]
MIDPIALGQNKEFVAKQDRNKDGTRKEDATIWILGPLDSMQKALITAHSVEDDSVVVEDKGKESKETEKIIKVSSDCIIKQDFEIVRQGLKGFSNFGSIEYSTEKIKFFNKEIDVLSNEILLVIPIIRELADAIWGENEVDEGLIKN